MHFSLPVLLTALAIAETSAQKAPMKVLFWGGQSGIHNTQDQGNRFIAAMKLVGIQVDYTGNHDNSDINDGNLANYDALVSFQQSGAGGPAITYGQVDALYRFVESGKGIIFTHMSLVAQAQAKDRYQQLLGGYFLEHGNGRYYGEHIQIDSNNNEHPAYKGTPIWTGWDETYLNQIYSGSTVLQHRSEQDKGPSDWTWVRNQGNGRVYYTSYGHDSNTWGNAGFMKQLEIALAYVTEPLRGPTVALNRAYIFPEPRSILTPKRAPASGSGSGFKFSWGNQPGYFSLDGRNIQNNSSMIGNK